jgi:hypothetical protein
MKARNAFAELHHELIALEIVCDLPSELCANEIIVVKSGQTCVGIFLIYHPFIHYG